ncbi:MAG: hypothetical protein ACKOAS_09630 [Verrucomicrobiota bacterium]
MFKAAIVAFGFALLALACLAHAFEHYESVAFENCLATCGNHQDSSSTDSNDLGQTDHHHGCNAHEHSPAILEISVPFFAGDSTSDIPEIKFPFPPSLPVKIELPPRLS